MIKSAVITISDKASKGERIDESGKIIQQMLKTIDANIMYYKIVPDELDDIKNELLNLCKSGFDLILTTGGTGLSPRDVTPEATISVVEKRIYGIEIAMISKSMVHTPFGMLSRAIAGIRGKTLIINLPGSPRAVEENLSIILPVIPHA
ncbi:MogA/MoaB family molybdenum cofactor biosynthesis protein, partial [Pseudothermotoga sp.]